ncbi:hypothetical protein GCM10010149_88420 [Nonomuraea roseoviolacea subsp. roseoviolacea]|uniref:hypothetical protein n=1 Tax=Nonomuraea roseoviolacea TaxID=103837 RepID=UPI0031CFA626
MLASEIVWDNVETLGTGQCCDRKIDVNGVTVWVCRAEREYGYQYGTVLVSVEEWSNGSRSDKYDHVPADSVELPDWISEHVG